MIDRERLAGVLAEGVIPREDATVYLTVLAGEAECFVSSNNTLIKATAASRSEFESCTAGEFVARHILNKD